MDEIHESEERVHLNAPLYEAPGGRHGATNRKTHRPRVRASEAKLPGTSMRGERRKQDEAMAKPETLAERMARMKAMPDLARPGRKRQELVQGAVDFRWKVDKDTDEATYVAFINPHAIGFEDRGTY